MFLKLMSFFQKKLIPETGEVWELKNKELVYIFKTANRKFVGFPATLYDTENSFIEYNTGYFLNLSGLKKVELEDLNKRIYNPSFLY